MFASKPKITVKNTLQSNRLQAIKSRGQNFLNNPAIVQKIIEAADLMNNDTVVEIGPGLGVLTESLCAKTKKTHAVELDTGLVKFLQEKFKNKKNIEIIHQDALQYIPPSTPYKLIANIPYYITSPILNHFLEKQEEKKRPKTIVLMVQKEVADKICSKKGNHSILSLEIQAFGKATKICDVSKNNFYPIPKVDSAIIKIQPYKETGLSDIKLFFQLIKCCFSNRRKMLSNTLAAFTNGDKKATAQILTASGILPSSRPQELDIENWEKLIRSLKNYRKEPSSNINL